KSAELESEVLNKESDEVSEAEINLDEEAEKSLVVEQGADADRAESAEEAAIHEEKSEALNPKSETSPKSEGSKSKTKISSKKKVKTRSAKYLKHAEQVEKGKLYNLEEAIELVKKLTMTKYDGAVELHIRLSAKKAKGSTESSRGLFHLPHGSGKSRKIIILDEAKIEEIAKTKKIDFDVALASPELMPKVAKIAKILGPKGKMPDPKSGTVTSDPKRTIEEINSGKVEYRVDSTNNIHQIVGRVSWENTKLAENIKAVLGSLSKGRMNAAYLTASVAPSIPLDLSFLK
ncbi:MAG TPA: hypothetical protein VMQ44_01100, partial [Candidatus Saccharimonadales bacterium]|nr:hypothetical protein [Candidatus Saccharimonadales bacterium]